MEEKEEDVYLTAEVERREKEKKKCGNEGEEGHE